MSAQRYSRVGRRRLPAHADRSQTAAPKPVACRLRRRGREITVALPPVGAAGILRLERYLVGSAGVACLPTEFVSGFPRAGGQRLPALQTAARAQRGPLAPGPPVGQRLV